MLRCVVKFYAFLYFEARRQASRSLRVVNSGTVEMAGISGSRPAPDQVCLREGGLEPPRLAAPDPKSGASAVPPLSRGGNYPANCEGLKPRCGERDGLRGAIGLEDG